MKTITKFDSIDFLTYVIGKIERYQESYNNYQHTHDRIHYDPATGFLSFEEVYINQDGSCFGRGIFGEAYIPVEWNVLLPVQLLESPNWIDL